MKSYIKKTSNPVLLFLLLAPAICFSQGIEIQSGGSIVNTGATNIEINNGNFLNNGTYTKGGETFTLSGTTSAQISGAQISDFNNLAITNTGGVSLVHDAKVTVTNILSVASLASLTILSEATGAGSLIVNSSLSNSGAINSERFLPGAAQAWRMLSTSMNGMAISDSEYEPDAEDDFYAWNEPSPGIWVNYKNGTVSPTFVEVNGGDNFVSGKGYLVAYNVSNPTKTFSGTLNYGNVNFNLKNTGALRNWTYVSGWNLIGNPYSSAINWNLADRSNFQDEFAYIYNPNKAGGEGYVPIDGSSENAYIAANQGFFVIADLAANNQNFTFTSAIQTHEGGNYLKSANNAEELILRLSSESYYDDTQIRITEQSNFYRDRQDALKIYSFNNSIPQIYSQSTDDIKLAVNSIPFLDAEIEIALGMVLPISSSYNLTIETISDQMASNSIFLEDKDLGSWHKLNEGSYSFTSVDGEIANRFVLHFGAVGINESNIEAEQSPRVWLSGGSLNVQSNYSIQLLEIFDLQGREIMSKNIEGNNVSISLNLPSGMYLARVQNSTTKIVVANYN